VTIVGEPDNYLGRAFAELDCDPAADERPREVR